MAKEKLYQYLQGEQRGKVVALVGIEKEEDMVFLKFDDGSRCNVDFAAKLNDARAYTDGKFVAEVCDRSNVWSFQDKSIKEEVRYGTLKDTGETVAGWDPYIHGRFGNENKRKVNIVAIPPKHTVTKAEMRSSAERLQELGIDESTPGYDEGVLTRSMPTKESLMSKLGPSVGFQNKTGGNYEDVLGEVYDEKGNLVGKTTLGLDPTGAKPPSMKDMEQYIRSTEIYIPEELREELDAENAKPAAAREPAKPTVSNEYGVTGKVDRIMEGRQTVGEKPIAPQEPASAAPERKDFHNSPVFSIIDKCKKKEVTIPIELKVSLPGKSVYNLIKEDFGDEACDEFIDIIFEMINTEPIRLSLRNALRSAYEGAPESQDS